MLSDINYFKKKNKVEINIFSNNSLDCSDYIIEFFSKTNKVLEKIEKISILKKIVNLKQEIKETNNKKFKKKNFIKKNILKKKLNNSTFR